MKYVIEDGKVKYSFEPGDWVRQEVASNVWTFRIKSVSSTDNNYNADMVVLDGRYYDGAWENGDKGRFSTYEKTRPATLEEVKAALAICDNPPFSMKIGDYKVALQDANTITVGCQKVTKEQFLEIGKGAKWL